MLRRGMRAWALAAALAGAVVGSAAPAGADAGTDLAAGERAMTALDYRGAVTLFERVTTEQDATARELVHAYGALVRCHVVLGGENAARAAAIQLIELDPGARLAGGAIPPRVTRFFEDVRAEHRRTANATVTVRVPQTIEAGEVIEIVVASTAARRAVDDIQLFCMFGAGNRWTTVDLTLGRRGWVGRVRVPAGFSTDEGQFRYYAVAFAPSGTAIGGLGSSDDPMVVGHAPPTEPPPPPAATRPRSVRTDIVAPPPEDPRPSHVTPITGRWWFWTGLAAVLAGGIVAVVLVTDQGAPAREGGDGVYRLP